MESPSHVQWRDGIALGRAGLLLTSHKACKETLLYGPAVQVFYKPKVITTPTGCSDVALKVEYV